MMKSQAHRVIRYYEQTRWEYKYVWRSNERLAIHFGYFDDSIHRHRESLTKMTEVLASHVAISSEDRVLDAGCGVGGCDLWLAEHLGCRVTGINITPYQLQVADNAARQLGRDRLVSFVLTDFTRAGLREGCFTVVWCLESVVHAQDKEEFVAEAWRLLSPGGRLMIAEYMMRDESSLTQDEQAIMEPWLEGWAMPSLLSGRQYRQLLSRVGFDPIEVLDITEHVEPSLNRLEAWTRRLRSAASLLHRLRIVNSEQVKNANAAAAQMRAFRMGLWRYKVILAHRPMTM